MRRTELVYISLGMLLLGLGLGFILHEAKPLRGLFGESKPFTDVQAVQSWRIDEETLVIYEQLYEECQHVVIAEFPQAKDLIGKTEDDVRRQYNEQNGFRLTIRDNTIILRQNIPGWCPKEHERVRLKEYQGRLAIYKGPNASNDELFRVTDIKIDSLPEELVRQIYSGRYEFENEALLNDALENLDEYH